MKQEVDRSGVSVYLKANILKEESIIL
jgi:hypothetical protein